MYASVFEFDTQVLEQTYSGASWRNAYTDVRGDLTQRGCEWKQGSAYLGEDSVGAVRCVRVVQRLTKKHPWFAPSVRDIRMLRIEENDDLKGALSDEDED